MNWNDTTLQAEHDQFLANWKDHQNQTKKGYQQLYDYMKTLQDVCFSFKSRPGVSYSLRVAHKNQSRRDLFVMLDVIDDDPDERWLSICFYGDMITDPEEKGDLIPEGLLGEDGYCFDLDAWNEDDLTYLEKRLAEACASGAKE
jgi:hypothetical protein